MVLLVVLRCARSIMAVVNDTARILDPICDMIVDIASARDAGLTIERPEREYGFCSHGCLVKFAKAQTTYIPKVEAWLAAEARGEHAGAEPTTGEMKM